MGTLCFVRSHQLVGVQADQNTHADDDGDAAVRHDDDHDDALRQSAVVVTCCRTEIVQHNPLQVEVG